MESLSRPLIDGGTGSSVVQNGVAKKPLNMLSERLKVVAVGSILAYCFAVAYPLACVPILNALPAVLGLGVVASTPWLPWVALGLGGLSLAFIGIPYVFGFTAAGPAAGSLAAWWQSTIGNVAAGSWFAWWQSATMTGWLSYVFYPISALSSGVAGFFGFVSPPLVLSTAQCLTVAGMGGVGAFCVYNVILPLVCSGAQAVGGWLNGLFRKISCELESAHVGAGSPSIVGRALALLLQKMWRDAQTAASRVWQQVREVGATVCEHGCRALRDAKDAVCKGFSSLWNWIKKPFQT